MGVPKKIEAVTVCVGYDDFLTQVVPYNLPMFDRWIIVTEPGDEATREVCRRFGLDCLLTEDGRDNGEFSKGKMVERGLQHLSADGWRLHVDGDIALPRHFRKLVDMADLQHDTIYGVDRIMCRSWGDWFKLKHTGWLDGGQYAHSHAVHFPKGFTVGSRWASVLTGYVPIGFFQMWHSSQDEWRGIRTKPYPRDHNSACRTDVQMGLQWDRKKREIIPEILVAHLESEPCPKGTNWKGRKTRRFGPPSVVGPLTTES